MEVKELWNAVLGEIQTLITPTSFNTWLAHTKAQNWTENSIEIVFRNSFEIKNAEKFKSLIQNSVDKIGKGKYVLEFVVGEIEGAPSYSNVSVQQPKKDNIPNTETLPLFNNTKQRDTNEESLKAGLSPTLTFENYVMSSNNRLAYAVAINISEDPGSQYNPFFLHSGVGLGKTHLIQAIGNKIIKDKPDLKVIYTTGEAFMNELIEAIRGGHKSNPSNFRKKYRDADVFLIDDIQFIIGKEATQQEFFHTFNTLYMAKKQVIITSDRHPKAFNKLEDRITSRFASGIIADITKPDVDTRIAILLEKKDLAQDNISNDVINFIAENIDSNIRELEGAYKQVLIESRAIGEIPSVEIAAKTLNLIIKQNSSRQKQVNVNDIMKTVANYYTVKISEIKGSRRTQNIVIPRQVAMFLMYEMTNTPYVSIGELIGGRDHTTIMYGVRKVERKLEESQKIKQDILNIRQELRG